MSSIHDLAAWVDRLRNVNEVVARSRVDLELLGEETPEDPFPHMRAAAQENLAVAEQQFKVGIVRIKEIAEALSETS